MYYTNKELEERAEKRRADNNCVNALILELADRVEYKYWHDLISNPDDLPEDDGIYLVAFHWHWCKYKTLYYEVLQYRKSYSEPWISDYKEDIDVVAWKKFDEFEWVD